MFSKSSGSFFVIEPSLNKEANHNVGVHNVLGEHKQKRSKMRIEKVSQQTNQEDKCDISR